MVLYNTDEVDSFERRLNEAKMMFSIFWKKQTNYFVKNLLPLCIETSKGVEDDDDDDE